MEKQIVRGSIIQYQPMAHGSKQGDKMYFAIVLSNNANNRFSTILNVALISSSPKRLNSKLPVHVHIDLLKPSVIMCEQLETIDIKDVYRVTDWIVSDMTEVDKALAIQLGLADDYK